MPRPNQLAKFNFSSLQPDEQTYMNQLIDTINTHSGYNGPQQLASDLDLGGYKIRNLGPAETPTDAISSGVAASSYSAPVLKKQIEANGSSSLTSYRILNSKSQREQSSSWLNRLMSSVPNANGILPTLEGIGGGLVEVSIPAERFTFADQSSILMQARSDTLSPPTSYSITSISAVGNLVTVNVSAATGLVAGDLVTIAAVTPTGFNGSFVLTASSGGGAVLQYNANVGTVSGSGGDVELANVYYYAIRENQTQIQLFGPYNGDTQQNRLQVNYDGYQIVAVVVLTASGGSIDQTGGGGTPIIGSPTAGSFF